MGADTGILAVKEEKAPTNRALKVQSSGVGALSDPNYPDPLHGNYQLLPLYQIIVAHQAKGKVLRIATMTNAEIANKKGEYQTSLGAVADKDKACDSRKLALTSGDFDADGLDEICAVYETPEGLRATVARSGKSATIIPVAEMDLGVRSSGPIALKAGSFVAGSGEWIALTVLDEAMRIGLQLYSLGSDLKLVCKAVAKGGGANTASPFHALARGDLNGDGLDELVLAWVGEDGLLRLRVFSVDAKGTTIAAHNISDGLPVALGSAISLVTGDFNGDGRDEIAVACESPEGKICLRLFKPNSKDFTLEARGSYIDEAPKKALFSGKRLAVTAIDLDHMKADAAAAWKIALAYEIDDNAVQLRLFQSDSQLNISANPGHLKSSTVLNGDANHALTDFDLQIEAGSLDGGAPDCIIIGSLGARREPSVVLAGLATLTVAAVTVSPDMKELHLQQPYVYDLVEDTKLDICLGLALGDLRGASIRVGSPKRFMVDKIENILAVINAPPLHLYREQKIGDDGKPTGEFEETNINFNDSSTIIWGSEQSRESSFTAEYKSDWGFSETLHAKVQLVAALDTSLTRRYGTNFKKSGTQTNTINVSRTITAWKDDVIIRSTVDYVVWEYPVFEASNELAGHMVVVFPSRVQVREQAVAGNSAASGYFPDHIVGNILSYRSFGSPPDDYEESQRINIENIEVGNFQSSLTINWEKMQGQLGELTNEQETTVSVEVSLDGQFKALSFGLGAKVEGNYKKSEVKTVETKLTEKTKIEISFKALEKQAYTYRVKPMIYWSSPLGYLKVDYQVDGFDNDTPLWFERTYTRPDLSFSHTSDSAGPGYTELTRDIFFRSQADGTVKIDVTVRNPSLVGTDISFPVIVYEGDPRQGGKKIARETVPGIAARQTYMFTISWTPSKQDIFKVYAHIDPDDTVKGLNRLHAIGWSQFNAKPKKIAKKRDGLGSFARR